MVGKKERGVRQLTMGRGGCGLGLALGEGREEWMDDGGRLDGAVGGRQSQSGVGTSSYSYVTELRGFVSLYCYTR